jgi:hypothetical protein
MRILIFATSVTCGVMGYLAGHYWTLKNLGESVNWPVTFEAWSHIAQVMALAIGAWWTYRLFVRERVDKARANITHGIQCIPLSDAHRLVRIVVHIHNPGNVEIQPPSGNTKLEYAKFEANNKGLRWEKHSERKLPFKRDDLAIEPGEEERYSVDFIVPADCELFQIKTEVDCGRHYKGEFWTETSLWSCKDISVNNLTRQGRVEPSA